MPEPTVNRTPLYALMVAHVVGLIGRQLSVVAIPWFVLTTTGSASRAGLVGAAVLLPGLVVGIFGGVLVDRLGYRKVSVTSDVVAAASTMMIPLLYTTIGLQFWQLLIFVFFGSLLDVPSLTARRSMVPELAKLAGMSLDKVNASFESLQNLSTLLGAPLAGALVAWMGAQHVLWLDAAASAISAVIVFVAIPGSLFVQHVLQQKQNYWNDVMTGLRFIRRDDVLWPMVILLAISNAMSIATFGVIAPVFFTTEVGSPASMGIVLAAMGGGAFLGSMAYGMVAGRIPRKVIWMVGYMVIPIEFWIFLVAPSVPLLVATFFFAGFIMGPINPIMVTLRHERSPLEIRGRVFSTYSAIALGAQPAGILIVGNMIDGFGFDPTLWVLTIIAQILGVSTLLVPGFRRMDDPPPMETVSSDSVPAPAR